MNSGTATKIVSLQMIPIRNLVQSQVNLVSVYCILICLMTHHSCSSTALDEDEIERRRVEKLNEMTDLEKQFTALREQLYYERLNQVEEKLQGVRSGKSSDYLQPLEDLQEHLRVRTEVAGVLKELKMVNVKCQHQAEILASKQHMEDECRAICDFIRSDLEDKIRKLEEDRNSLDSEMWNEMCNNVPAKRKKHYHHSSSMSSFDSHHPYLRDQLNLPDRRKKPVTVTGPFIVYMLRENEILEDTKEIRGESNYFF